MNSLGGSRENLALRTVRTKREADEAGAFLFSEQHDRGTSIVEHQIRIIGKVSIGWKHCDCDVQKYWRVDIRRVHCITVPMTWLIQS